MTKNTEVNFQQTWTYGVVGCCGQKASNIWGITDVISPSRHTQKSSQPVRACATGDGAISCKNRKILPYHGDIPNSRISARLRSPFPIMAPPCIRLERGKFELTNQDLAGGKNSSVLTSSWNQATFVTGELDGIKYIRKRICNVKNQTSWQKVKNMNHSVFLSFYFKLAPKMGHRRSACQLARSSSSIAR